MLDRLVSGEPAFAFVAFSPAAYPVIRRAGIYNLAVLISAFRAFHNITPYIRIKSFVHSFVLFQHFSESISAAGKLVV